MPESQTHPAAPPRTSLCGKDSSHWPMLRMGKLRPREARWPNPGLLTRSPLPSLPRSGSQGLPPQTGAGPAHLSPSCSGAGPRVRTGCLKPLGSLRGPKQTRAFTLFPVPGVRPHIGALQGAWGLGGVQGELVMRVPWGQGCPPRCPHPSPSPSSTRPLGTRRRFLERGCVPPAAPAGIVTLAVSRSAFPPRWGVALGKALQR